MDWLQTDLYEDTYLTKTQKPLIIKDPSDILSQKDLVELMNESGSNMDVKKIHMYRKRGKLPKETVMIGGKPYWIKEKVETYIKTSGIKSI